MNIQILEKMYLRGNYLGQGAYAKCFEITESETGKKYACKIIEKSKIDDERKKKKVEQELQLHRRLNHKHIV